jgi:hypothetical protein
MNKKRNMKNIIKDISDKKLQELEINGYLTPGHNGPYNDEETPARNTAHWLIIFSYLYSELKSSKYLNAVKKCAEYLYSDILRPAKATMICRKNKSKDLCNGLIGQAWIIEALVEAYKILEDKKYLKLATEIIYLHPFDEKRGIWKIVDVDGKIRNFDMTFNHQLWFAASASELYNMTKDNQIKYKIEKFLIETDRNLRIYNNGLIKHQIIFCDLYNEKIHYIMKNLKTILSNLIKNQSMIYKELGYHTFNVYAFAILYEKGFGKEFFNGQKFKKILEYTFSEQLFEKLKINNYKNDITNLPIINFDLEVNRYGYAYNAPGFEIPYISKVFKNKTSKDTENLVSKYINTQIELTYDFDKKMFTKNTEDGRVLTARIYELVRYLSLV